MAGTTDAPLTAQTLAPVVAAAEQPGGAAVAMAFVDAVPVGIYGKAALTSLGVWGAIAPGVVQTENVQACLVLVVRGEVPYGIVYTTDAAAEPGVTLVGRFATDLHPPIVYPAALLEGASPGADAFFDHLRGPQAWTAFDAAELHAALKARRDGGGLDHGGGMGDRGVVAAASPSSRRWRACPSGSPLPTR